MNILKQFRSAKNLCRRVVASAALVSVLASPFAAFGWEKTPHHKAISADLTALAGGKQVIFMDSDNLREQTVGVLSDYFKKNKKEAMKFSIDVDKKERMAAFFSLAPVVRPTIEAAFIHAAEEQGVPKADVQKIMASWKKPQERIMSFYTAAQLGYVAVDIKSDQYGLIFMLEADKPFAPSFDKLEKLMGGMGDSHVHFYLKKEAKQFFIDFAGYHEHKHLGTEGIWSEDIDQKSEQEQLNFTFNAEKIADVGALESLAKRYTRSQLRWAQQIRFIAAVTAMDIEHATAYELEHYFCKDNPKRFQQKYLSPERARKAYAGIYAVLKHVAADTSELYAARPEKGYAAHAPQVVQALKIAQEEGLFRTKDERRVAQDTINAFNKFSKSALNSSREAYAHVKSPNLML